MPMRVLVTGRGSIAQRHVRHLRELVPAVELAVISSTGEMDATFLPCASFSEMQTGLAWKPDAVVIASISSKHAQELELCLQLGIPCLIEKPLVVSRDQLVSLQQLAQKKMRPSALVVGCNLRYLPALRKLHDELWRAAPYRVLRAHLEVGQDLSQWRPSRDLETSYSAISSLGGGVIFDLVHEIDMAQWLLGPLQVHGAVGGHLSPLPIQSDDVHVALLKTVCGAPVVVSLDYVSQQAVRKYTIVTTDGTFEVDIIGKNITLLDRQGRRVITDIADDFDVKRTYQLQMMDWLAAIADPAHEVVLSFAEAVATADLMLGMQEAVS
ncbi:MAG: Gfo/Idh/MocA family oxidoreductase [Pseudomonadota bacterium]